MNLGRYNILEELGKGGFGTVYKAEDQVLGRVIALKVLHPSLVINTAFVDRFRREARLSAQLEHPNLVPVYDFSEIEGRFVISMSYMAGGSLKNLLAKKGKLAPERVRQILGDVCAGLGYAHAKGIIHRDLKPGNILLDEHGRARVGDLGFARVITDASSLSMSTSGGMVGTPAYMAPELWRNKPASVQTDIYSSGCILYEMLTGKVLFEGTSPAEVMTMHVIDGPQFEQELPDGWRALIEKCVAMDPKERYSCAEAPLRDLDRGVLEASNRIAEQNSQSPEQPERACEVRNGGVGSAADEPASRIPPWKRTDGSYSTDQAGRKPKKRQWVIGAVIGALLLILGILTAKLLSTQRQTAAIPLPTEPPLKTATLREAFTEEISESQLSTPTATGTPVTTSTSQPSLEIGSTLTREKDGMLMVFVPAGEFTMGSEIGENDEKPVRQIYLDAFWIDKFEVNNQQYVKCVNAQVCTDPSQFSSKTIIDYYQNPAYKNFPVLYIDWNQARTYCEWVGGSLPTEAQWEKAAKIPFENIFPWGNDPPNCRITNFSLCKGDTVQVGSYPEGSSSCGAMDMSGNVWEWVHDWYGEYQQEDTYNPRGPVTGQYRVLRGGSWKDIEVSLRVSNRSVFPSDVSEFIGFRCVYPMEGE
jgi:serine/threonine protein kinase